MSNKLRNKAVRVKSSKMRSNSSTKWLNRQLNDPYVMQARSDGYRSRASYKLIEINQKYQLLKSSMVVVDLGAAPGGWSQVSTKIVGEKGVVVAIDLIEMEPITGVIAKQMDFNADDAGEEILRMLEGRAVDVVMSDMAANAVGHQKTDHLRIMALCERSFEFATKILRPGGHFITKIFRGGTENELLSQVKKEFAEVKHFKPKSSRSDSTEIYLVAKNFKKLSSDGTKTT